MVVDYTRLIFNDSSYILKPQYMSTSLFIYRVICLIHILSFHIPEPLLKATSKRLDVEHKLRVMLAALESLESLLSVFKGSHNVDSHGLRPKWVKRVSSQSP